MSLPHGRGRLDWADLSALAMRYRDPGVELPVGMCGRIHLDDKRTTIRVERRKYLAGRVCRLDGCTTRGTEVFRKNRAHTLTLPGELPRPTREIVRARARLTRFGRTLDGLIGDSARHALRTAGPARSAAAAVDHHPGCRCAHVVDLMESGSTRELLSLGDSAIRAALDHRHGGQAVGNNLLFLHYHVLHTYLRTNMIVAFGLADRPQDWGSMSPGSSFRRRALTDCDGQTFLPAARRLLHDDVYLVDMMATEQLVTACFGYLVQYRMLCENVDYASAWTAQIHPELGLPW
ncbi:hypothetical protein [Nocardia crassostreae]|uniref:hypothetical protein n=1 Tax=Nocardia crassostreae TaxID=53428 RepID=UPI0008296F78|nr:hypothetical protein [Nocardia crassostreae]